jgi:hypothetical protein
MSKNLWLKQQVLSYKGDPLAKFYAQDYQEKDIQFTYNENEYHFKVKVNPQVSNFANYPVVDYGTL